MRRSLMAAAAGMLAAGPAVAQVPVVDGFTRDPVTGVVEAPYVLNGITYTQDQVSGDFAGLLYTAEDDTTLYFAFEQSVHMNDNTYGANSIGWTFGRDHTLKDLEKSENAKVRLYDCAGNLVLDFQLDYITEDKFTGTYACGGVTDGDGAITVGDPAAITGVACSIGWNLNLAQPVWPDRFTVSPARVPTNTYDPGTTADPDYPWIYPLVYEWSVDRSVFPNGCFGGIEILEVHNSPYKTGNPVPIPVVSGSKLADPASGTAVVNGSTILYTLTYYNPGDVLLTDVVITDVVDADLTDVVPLDGGACSDPVCGPGSTLTWLVGTLAPGETVSVRFQATADFQTDGEIIFNKAELTAAELPSPFETNTTEHPCLDSDGDGGL